MATQSMEIGFDTLPHTTVPEKVRLELIANNMKSIVNVEESSKRLDAKSSETLKLIDHDNNEVNSVWYDGLQELVDDRNRSMLNELYGLAGVNLDNTVTIIAAYPDGHPTHRSIRRLIPNNGAFIEELVLQDLRYNKTSFSVSVQRRGNAPLGILQQLWPK